MLAYELFWGFPFVSANYDAEEDGSNCLFTECTWFLGRRSVSESRVVGTGIARRDCMRMVSECMYALMSSLEEHPGKGACPRQCQLHDISRQHPPSPVYLYLHRACLWLSRHSPCLITKQVKRSRQKTFSLGSYTQYSCYHDHNQVHHPPHLRPIPILTSSTTSNPSSIAQDRSGTEQHIHNTAFL